MTAAGVAKPSRFRNADGERLDAHVPNGTLSRAILVCRLHAGSARERSR